MLESSSSITVDFFHYHQYLLHFFMGKQSCFSFFLFSYSLLCFMFFFVQIIIEEHTEDKTRLFTINMPLFIIVVDVVVGGNG